jgi:hypothetical protein
VPFPRFARFTGAVNGIERTALERLATLFREAGRAAIRSDRER